MTITRNNLVDYVNRARRAIAGSGDTAALAMVHALPDDRDVSDTRKWDDDCREQVVHFAMEHVRKEFEVPTWRAFYATVVEDRPAAEVASELDVSVGAVYVAKSRVTGRLRRVVEELENDD